MKYLNALLREAKNPPHTYSKEPTKPTKPVSSVLSGSSPRDVGEKSVAKTGQDRPFLPHPLGQEDAPNPYVAWDSLLCWLIEHHPDHFSALYDAEDVLHALEAQGVTSGAEYEGACQELFTRFERSRRLKLSQGFKIWLQ